MRTAISRVSESGDCEGALFLCSFDLFSALSSLHKRDEIVDENEEQTGHRDARDRLDREAALPPTPSHERHHHLALEINFGSWKATGW